MANVRLRQAAAEFGVGVETIVSTLEKANLPIEHNPNAKLTNEQYELVQKKHQKDKDVKDAASQVDIAIPEKKKNIASEVRAEKIQEVHEISEENPIVKVETQETKEKKKSEPKSNAKISQKTAEKKNIKVTEPLSEEVLPIVETAAEIVVEVPKEEKKEAVSPKEEEVEIEVVAPKEIEVPQEVIIPQLSQEVTPSQLPQQEVIEIVKEDVKVVEAVKVEPIPEVKEIVEPILEIVKEDIVLNIIENNEQASHELVVDLEEGSEKSKGPVVVGTIDLNQFKKNKKGSHPKKDAHTTHTHESKHAKVKDNAEHKEVSSTKETVEETVAVKAVEKAVVEVKKEEVVTEFIKTQYTKLEGPKFVDVQKIDLSQFNKKPKPVASSKDMQDANKKKRKRIKDDKPAGSPTSNVKMISKPDLKTSNTHSGGSSPWQGKKTGGKHSKGVKAPVVVDSNEIEKQIKETLARLSPMGKSKFSKHRREKRQNINTQMEVEQEKMNLEKNILKVTEFVTVNELATMMDVPVTKIIATCMGIGLFVSINQRLTAEPIALLAEEFGFNVEFVDAEVLDSILDDSDLEEGTEPRTPVVTVMGHVDHGKTSLLDYIRSANVIAGEAGGITQHIGAYEVQLENGKKITFLDTPGHEAFTAMRARGAKITDIAIIVISADDRIMPQTIEAINHAQAAGVPLVFAINKIDKEGANPDQIKTELANMNLLVEEWGGKYQSQDISAKKGMNVDVLLEKVLLEAEMLDLKCNPNKRAKGTVIESSLDKGRGFVAKILIEDGTVRVGDPILAGSNYGKVKAMYNERNQSIKEAGPATPVLMLGLNGAPQAGDIFNVTATEKDAKDVSTRRVQLQREQGLRTQKHITLDEIGRRIAIGDFKELNVIVKGDVDGSIEALSDSLLKLSTPEVQVNVIHKSVGQISESDILLASASEAIVIGFQVRPSMSARKLAETEQIDIRLYSIIYDAINEIKDAIEGMLSPEIQEKIVSNIEVREIFKIGKVGTIAGCMVLDGKINRQTRVRLIRDGIVVYTGKLGSLKRFKDDVKEVVVGQDCGLNIDNFNDVKVGDIVEGYEISEVKRSL